MCAVALFGMTACQKDDPTPEPTATQNQGSGETPQTPTETDRAGVYAPESKIVSISVDGELSEEWNWEDGKLMSVSNAAGQDKVNFTYGADGRVNTMTVNATDMLSGIVTMTYSGESLSQLALDGANSVTAQLTNNASNKVTKATLDLGDIDLSTLLGMFQSAVSEFVGDGDMSGVITGVDSISGSMDFGWAGANVNTAITTIGARLATTIGRVAAVMPSSSEFYSTLQQIAQSNPDMPLFIKVTLCDTSSYSYDQKVNPFRHYMGNMVAVENNVPHFNVAALSANNVTEERRSASVKLGVATVISIMSNEIYQTLYNTDKPMYSTESAYSYSYRSDSYPETVTGDSGQTTTYTYQQ
jgi:hypothetical protein